MKINIDKYRFYFFDFDGVLVDSLGIKTEAFGSLFEGYGEEIVKKVRQYHMDHGGVSRYKKFQYYYEVLLKKTITPEIMKRLDDEFSKCVKEKVIKAPMIPGAQEFLDQLKDKRKNMFVISGTPQEEIRDIVHQRKLSPFFKEVLGSPKTKDENLKILMKKYNVQSSEAIFFGDALSDYSAATGEHIDFVAVAGDHNEEIFRPYDVRKIKSF